MTGRNRDIPEIEMHEEGARMARSIQRGHCPECRHRGFVIGPQGGMSINIECGNLACRCRFNVAYWQGAVAFVHRLEKASEGGARWASEPCN